MHKKKKNSTSYYNNTAFDLEVRPSQIVDAGQGLFLNANAPGPIPAGAFIGYYEGVWNCDPKKHSNYSHYINKRVCIDIDFTHQPITSMMNDAYRTDYKNNVISKILVNEPILESIRSKNCDKFDPCRMVGLYALTQINPGQELFFEYGESYWKSW
jgi:hypothetical protein